MDTITIPVEWKKLFGFTGASILQYLVDRDDGDWFHVPQADMRDDLLLHPSGINAARERLRAERVIDVRKTGNRYEYHINHDVPAEIEKGQE